MDADKSPHNHIVLNHHMPAESRPVGDYIMATENTIMRDVAIHHKKVMIPDAGYHPSPCGSGIERNELPDGVAISDDELAVLAPILEILRNGTDRGELEDHVALAQGRIPFYHYVGFQACPFTDFDLWADYAVRANLYVGSQLRARINQGFFMNLSHSRLRRITK